MAHSLILIACVIGQVLLLHTTLAQQQQPQQQSILPPLVAIVTERKLYGSLGNLDQFLLGYGQNVSGTQVERADEPVMHLPEETVRTIGGRQLVFDQQYPDETRTGTVNLNKEVHAYTVQRRNTNIINRALYRYLKNLNVDTVYNTNLQRVNHPKIIDVNVNQLQETYQPRLIVKYSRKDILNNVSERNETPIVETETRNELLTPIFEPATAERVGYTGQPLLGGSSASTGQSNSLIIVPTDLTPGGNLPSPSVSPNIFQQTNNLPPPPTSFVPNLGGFGSSASSGQSNSLIIVPTDLTPGGNLPSPSVSPNIFQQTNNLPPPPTSFVPNLGGFGSGADGALADSQQPRLGSNEQVQFTRSGQPGDSLRVYAARSSPPPGSTLGPLSLQTPGDALRQFALRTNADQLPQNDASANQATGNPGDALRAYATRSVPPPGSSLGPLAIQLGQQQQQSQASAAEPTGGDSLRAYAKNSSPLPGSTLGPFALQRSSEASAANAQASFGAAGQSFLGAGAPTANSALAESQQPSSGSAQTTPLNPSGQAGDSLRAFAARSTPPAGSTLGSQQLTNSAGGTTSEADFLRRFTRNHPLSATDNEPGSSLRAFALRSLANNAFQGPAVSEENASDSLRRRSTLALASDVQPENQQQPAGDFLRAFAAASILPQDGDSLRKYALRA